MEEEGAQLGEQALNGEPKEENDDSLDEKEVEEDDGPALPLGLTGKPFAYPDFVLFLV